MVVDALLGFAFGVWLLDAVPPPYFLNSPRNGEAQQVVMIIKIIKGKVLFLDKGPWLLPRGAWDLVGAPWRACQGNHLINSTE